MAKNNERDPNLRAKTVARVNQLLKSGLSKAGAFEKISAETGRAKDAVQMLYYRAMRAEKAAPKAAAPKAPAVKAAPKMVQKAATPAPAAVVAPKAKPARRRRRSARKAAPRTVSVAQTGEFPSLLNGIASAINALLKHVEKTVNENKTLRDQSQRLQAIASLLRGK